MSDNDVPVDTDFDTADVAKEVEQLELLPNRRRGGWIRGVAIVALLAWSAALFAAGVAVGVRQRIEPPAAQPDIDVSIAQVEIPDAPAAQAPSEASVVPNVLALSPADARAALADAGHDGDVTVVDQPIAGPPGFVLAQEPAPGAPLGGDVVLTVAVPTAIPDVVGRPLREATAEVEALGAQARIRTEYRQGVEPDQVLQVEPAEGDLPLEVEFLVSTPPAQLDLTDLDPLQENCARLDGFGVAGRPQSERTWVCEVPPTTRARSVAWDLSRDVDEVRVVVGLTDDSDPAATSRVDVLIDDVVVQSQAATFGNLVEFLVPTDGALRLEVLVTTDAPDDVFSEWDRSRVAIVDVVAVGAAAALDELAGLNS